VCESEGEAVAKLDSDDRTDRGTPYTEKLSAAVEVFSELYPHSATQIKQAAARFGDNEEQSRRLYLQMRELMFSGVNAYMNA